jgi:hypothetical protein
MIKTNKGRYIERIKMKKQDIGLFQAQDLFTMISQILFSMMTKDKI